MIVNVFASMLKFVAFICDIRSYNRGDHLGTGLDGVCWSYRGAIFFSLMDTAGVRSSAELVDRYQCVSGFIKLEGNNLVRQG